MTDPTPLGNVEVLQGTTTGGLPYPESSDPLNQGANAIKALALALDPRAILLTTGTPLNGTVKTPPGKITGNMAVATPAASNGTFAVNTGLTTIQYIHCDILDGAAIGSTARVYWEFASTPANFVFQAVGPTGAALGAVPIRFMWLAIGW